MIHHIMLAAENDEDWVPLTEPPERYLRVEVVDGVAILTVVPLNQNGDLQEATAQIAVSAGSLMRALQVQTIDREAGLPASWEHRSRPVGESSGHDGKGPG
jgi:hypothetical protein